MTVNELLKKIADNPESVEFPEVIATIDENYRFTETDFSNGSTTNKAGQNNGSCKILAFAKLHDLGPESTLSCFGQYYYNDVLTRPEGDDHQNIRQFMIHGWSGVSFSANPLN